MTSNRMSWHMLPAFLLLLAACCISLQVQGSTPEAIGKYSLSLMYGRQSDTDLVNLPERLFNDLRLKPTRFLAVNGQRVIPRLSRAWVSSWLDLNVLKHHGEQDNWEAAGALLVKTPRLDWKRIIGIRLSAGIGLSYAFDTPTAEDGTQSEPDRRYRFLLFLPLELSVHAPDNPHWEGFLRVHHRSGTYGLVAPRHVGSNFLALGMRYNF